MLMTQVILSGNYKQGNIFLVGLGEKKVYQIQFLNMEENSFPLFLMVGFRLMGAFLLNLLD